MRGKEDYELIHFIELKQMISGARIVYGQLVCDMDLVHTHHNCSSFGSNLMPLTLNRTHFPHPV